MAETEQAEQPQDQGKAPPKQKEIIGKHPLLFEYILVYGVGLVRTSILLRAHGHKLGIFYLINLLLIVRRTFSTRELI